LGAEAHACDLKSSVDAEGRKRSQYQRGEAVPVLSWLGDFAMLKRWMAVVMAVGAVGACAHRRASRIEKQAESRGDVAAASALMPVALFDDFSDPAAMSSRWDLETAGAASIVVANHMAILDMPAGEAAGNSDHLVARPRLRFNHAGDAARVTWDMQIVRDQPTAGFSGLAIGVPDGQKFVVAQAGGAARTPHELRVSGFGEDHVNHGTGMLHYDLTITTESAGQVGLLLAVYARQAGFDTTPDSYVTGATPLSVLHGHGSVNKNADLHLYFWVEREDATGDPQVNTARATVGIANVYSSFLSQ